MTRTIPRNFSTVPTHFTTNVRTRTLYYVNFTSFFFTHSVCITPEFYNFCFSLLNFCQRIYLFGKKLILHIIIYYSGLFFYKISEPCNGLYTRRTKKVGIWIATLHNKVGNNQGRQTTEHHSIATEAGCGEYPAVTTRKYSDKRQAVHRFIILA